MYGTLSFESKTWRPVDVARRLAEWDANDTVQLGELGFALPSDEKCCVALS